VRFNSDLAGRPELVRGDRQLAVRRDGRLSESSILNPAQQVALDHGGLRNPEQAEGVIIALGRLRGGLSVYAKQGVLKYCYNFFGSEAVSTSRARPVLPRRPVIRFRVVFEYAGGGPAKRRLP
jgi:arylsulfatase